MSEKKKKKQRTEGQRISAAVRFPEELLVILENLDKSYIVATRKAIALYKFVNEKVNEGYDLTLINKKIDKAIVVNFEGLDSE